MSQVLPGRFMQRDRKLAQAQHRHPTPTFYHRIEFEAVYHGFQYKTIAQAVYIGCQLIGQEYNKAIHDAQIAVMRERHRLARLARLAAPE